MLVPDAPKVVAAVERRSVRALARVKAVIEGFGAAEVGNASVFGMVFLAGKEGA